MKGTIDTSLGNIQIDESVIAQYAGTVAMECFGIVGMTNVNVKDGLIRILKKNNAGHGIAVKAYGDHLVLDFHIIVSYGVSIIAVTDNLISSVKYKVENLTGLKVDKINVFVEGIRVID